MLFHCLQRSHGFAVLWSPGCTQKHLVQILSLEALRSLIHGMLYALPASCLLCFFRYGRYALRCQSVSFYL